MGLFRSIGRFFRACGYVLTGRMDKLANKVSANPAAVRATYGNIIRDKVAAIQDYKSAVATLIAQEKKKLATIKRLGEELLRQQRIKAGAGAKAKEIAAQLAAEGIPSDRVPHDERFMQCKAAFNDASSTVSEKEARIADLEGDVKEYQKRIKKHKVQLTSLQRDIEKIRDEQADAVADIITATEEKEMNDALSGVALGGTGEELQRMRDLREQLKAEAQVSSELAGTDTRHLEAEFEEFARASESNDEFDAMVNLKPMDRKLEELEARLGKKAEKA